MGELDLHLNSFSYNLKFIWVGKKGNRGFSYLDKYDPKPAASLAAGITGMQGKRQLIVSNSQKLEVGQRVQILWHNKQGEHGSSNTQHP